LRFAKNYTNKHFHKFTLVSFAGIAQLVEQRIRKAVL